MNIKFKKLTIQNFMSIGEVELNLDELTGYCLISGINNKVEDSAKSNGSGKSSIFEAIVWALTGDTMRGNKNVTNYNGTDGAYVDISFDIDNDIYNIIRTRDHSKFKNNLFIYKNNENISGRGIRDSEKLLAEYLPDLSASLIGSVIILGQGLPNRFTNNSPSGRKEVLEKLCKSDFMIEDLKQRVNTRKTQLASEFRTCEDNLLAENTKIKINEEAFKKISDKLDSLQDAWNYDDRIQELREAIQKDEEQLNDLDRQINNIDINSLLNEKSNLFETEQNMIASIKEQQSPEIDSLYKLKNEVLVKKLSIEKEINRIKNITDICPTCGQKINGIEKPDTTQLENELANVLNTYNSYDSQYNEKVKQLNESLSKVEENHKKQFEDINSKIEENNQLLHDLKVKLNSTKTIKNENEKELNKLIQDKDNLQSNIEQCNFELKELDKSLVESREKVASYLTQKDDLDKRITIINKFNNILSRDFRGYLLNEIITYIDKKCKQYCKDIFNTDLIEFKLDGNNIEITYCEKSYEALSGGERQKIDLIVQFAIRDMLCKNNNFSCNIIVLDEIFDALDSFGSQKVIDLITNKLYDINNIFIISHHGNELNIPCDNEIIIVKDSNGVSYIK